MCMRATIFKNVFQSQQHMLLKQKGKGYTRYTIDCPFILISIVNRCVTLSVYIQCEPMTMPMPMTMKELRIWIGIHISCLLTLCQCFRVLFTFAIFEMVQEYQMKRKFSEHSIPTQQINKTSIQTVVVFLFLSIQISMYWVIVVTIV